MRGAQDPAEEDLVEQLVTFLTACAGEDASPLRDKAEEIALSRSRPSPALTPWGTTVWALERMKSMMTARGLSVPEILGLDWDAEVQPVRLADEVLACSSEYYTMRSVLDFATRIEALASTFGPSTT